MTLKEQGNSRGQFQKGMVPWNKGLKGVMKANRGCFKKGNLPKNTQFDGAITIRYYGTSKFNQAPYKFIRLSLSKWVLLHHHVWKQANGPIPKGCIVAFKDGDTMNCELENLVLMTRAENVKRNSFHRYPADLKYAMKTIKKLKKTIKDEECKH